MGILLTCNLIINKVNNDTTNACAIANIDRCISLLVYQLITDPGITTGRLKSIINDNSNMPTNKANERIYGAVESR